MSNCAYESIEIAKDGNSVCIFSDKKAMFSKYAPIKDASNYAKDEKTIDASFIVVGGIGNGYHLEQIRLVNKEAVIIAFENNKESLNFILTKTDVEERLIKNQIIFCTLENLQETILQNFLPFNNNNFLYINHLVWAKYYHDELDKIQQIISTTLKLISSDFSVQAHFGLIWNKNIFSNLYLFQKNMEKFHTQEKFPIQKKAIIIGAGPSLDYSISEISKNRDDLYLIATDTALTFLLKKEIIPDAFISIDGQLVSYEHFFNLYKCLKKPLAIIDLCANPVVLRESLKASLNIQLIHNNHPLAKLAGNYFSNISYIYSGAGTVAMSAIDFAVTKGFKNIEIYGCDFMYSYGKPYVNGTYLENKFSTISSKLNTIEQQYSSIMFRTPLIKGRKENQFTTEVLLSYASDLENYCKRKILENPDVSLNIYKDFSMAKLSVKHINKQSIDCIEVSTNENKETNPFSKRDFFKYYLELLNHLKEDEYHNSLYPILCWYKNKYRLNDTKLLFFVKNLVKKQIANYNV